MRKSLARIKGLGFLLWQARHMVYHILVGLLWAWYLREKWGGVNPKWIALSVAGSLLPDLDHLVYFVGYGRRDRYAKTVSEFWYRREWRNLVSYMAAGHKHNTSLAYHNIYTMGILAVFGLVASMYNWQAGVVLLGAMVGHYLFDIADDIVQLGGINPNWKRWGRPRATP